MEYEIENAKIESTQLGYEGHNILTLFLTLELASGCGIGFGGYNLSGGEYCAIWIKKILDVVGVDSWEKLKGKHIRIKKEAGHSGRLVAIGNLMDNKWFNPKEDIK